MSSILTPCGEYDAHGHSQKHRVHKCPVLLIDPNIKKESTELQNNLI
jgi:hypothetical protein